jgi:threonine/homoserine/homoserine lactone efflux protein
MSDPSSFAAFLAIALVVILTPGQDTALTIRNTLIGGRPAGTGTAAGVATGQAVWTVATSLGITALLVASGPAFEVLRWLGAAYLVYLGLGSVRHAIRPGDAAANRPRSTGTGLGVRRAWRQGLISSLGNPKLAVFFSSLLPQFAPVGGGAFATMLALGGVFIAITFAWLCGYAFVVARAGERLRTGLVRRALDAVTGGILVAFGVRLAAATR